MNNKYANNFGPESQLDRMPSGGNFHGGMPGGPNFHGGMSGGPNFHGGMPGGPGFQGGPGGFGHGGGFGNELLPFATGALVGAALSGGPGYYPQPYPYYPYDPYMPYNPY